jgi:hypothetical protein
VSAVITRPHKLSWAKPFGELSTGPQLWATQKNSLEMPRVPILCQAAARLSLQASRDTANLVIRQLGARHDWASTNYSRRIKPSFGGYQQV